MYQNKNSTYFSNARVELINLIPSTFKKYNILKYDSHDFLIYQFLIVVKK